MGLYETYVSLRIDGHALKPQLLSMHFPATEEMKDGIGEIRIEFQAELPLGGLNRTLTFENHHQSRIAAYEVNCLVSRDPDIRIMAQKRNYTQSFYQLDYVQAGVRSGRKDWLGPAALLLFASLALMFRLRLSSSRVR